MKNSVIPVLVLLISSQLTLAQEPRTILNLNGTWEFDQTTKAFPPEKFTRKIPVPGLIHLAEPRIEEYDKFFKRPGKAESVEQFNLYNLDYTPRYSWYRKTVFIPKELEGKEGIITIKKSQYVTQIFINGLDMGTSMACYTPIEFPVNKAIKFGAENEVLIRTGERIWLPSEAAGGTDKEKEHYLPGIWDDIFLSFTGNIRINRLLVLPSVENKKVTVKAQIRSLIPAQIFYGDPMNDTVSLEIFITEKISGKEVAKKSGRFSVKRDNLTELALEIPLSDFTFWTPEKPFLYVATARLLAQKGVSDELGHQFGMRDFTTKGKFYYLNGEKYILRGTNITLQRFFEDPDCGNLVWDKEWVKKLLVNYPKQLNWNAMRICVGVVPDFWYDIADEYGLLLQNEWLYWQNHGWDDQIRKEYTDWVWTDGNHPSIAIWDAINENTDNFIGNTLIPDLQRLDPTRIWDAGYMREGLMKTDEMDEPHPYMGRVSKINMEPKKNFYPLGDLDFKPQSLKMIQTASVPQLANEYGWIWLWRNGMPSKLTVNEYDYYLGPDSAPEQNREFQAYYMQLETEWLRSEPELAGVLAFCYLANNYGYTGDWFMDNIKDLKPIPTLNWFRHAFAPTAVFVNLPDERYVKLTDPHKPGEKLSLKLAKINDVNKVVTGKVTLKIMGSDGKTVSKKNIPVTFSAFDRSKFSVEMLLPNKPGGYLLLAEFLADGSIDPVISRRYVKVGTASEYNFLEMKADRLKYFSRTTDTVIKELPPYFSILTTWGLGPEWDEKSKSITEKEYHVSVKGSDSNTGSASKPFKTISAAVRCAYPGDTITVHSGTYREWINPIRGGDSDQKRIVYRAAPGEKVEIKGSETITGWEKINEGVWKVTIPNSFFGKYNPYQDSVYGDWFNRQGRIHHTGEVFLNGKSLYEKETLEKVLNPVANRNIADSTGSTYTWYCENNNSSTIIWANFHKFNPNKELVEISTRRTVFYPDKPGLNYITISGFNISQAATQWGAPTAEQVGMIATHWNKGWIIENNIIHDSKCSGITLGKERGTGHNVWSADAENVNRDGNIHYIEVLFRVLRNGWNKENIGSHIVRNNTIFNCEQTGMCGSMGASFSRIENNHIYNIWTKRQFSGAEIGGIKFHAAVDTHIGSNRIHNCGRGIWLDWMTQGTRVAGNVMYRNDLEDIFLEVNHGPFIVDNNILLSPYAIRTQSEGGAYLHNLIAGIVQMWPEPNRFTPYFLPHSTDVAALTTILSGDDRYYNNIFIGKGAKELKDASKKPGLEIYDNAKLPVFIKDNLYYFGAKPSVKDINALIDNEFDPEINLEEKGESVFLHFSVNQLYYSHKFMTINTDILGRTRISRARFDNPDGTPLTIERDYSGDMRTDQNNLPGPFVNQKGYKITLKVW